MKKSLHNDYIQLFCCIHNKKKSDKIRKKFLRKIMDVVFEQWGFNVIMYPYATLNDATEITHAEMLSDERVKVCIETPDLKAGFHNATCYLPEHPWKEISGYSNVEMDYFKEFIRNNAHLIIGFAKEGGILNYSDKKILYYVQK